MYGSERLIVGPSHRRCESVQAVRGFASRPIWAYSRRSCSVGLWSAIRWMLVSVARAGEGGVGPVAGEGLWSADDERSVDGGALAGVAGDRVGVLDVVGEVVEVQPPMLAAIGLDLDGHAGSVVGGDRTEGAVVDVQAAVVSAGDDPVTDGPRAVLNPERLAGELATLAKSDSGGTIELFARFVVLGDQHDIRAGLFGTCVEPRVDRCFDGVTLGGVERDLLGFVLEVDLGIAVVQCRERLALGRITLAQHFAKLGAGVQAGQGSEPAAGLDAGQLAAVADGDHLDARLLGVSEDLRR